MKLDGNRCALKVRKNMYIFISAKEPLSYDRNLFKVVWINFSSLFNT